MSRKAAPGHFVTSHQANYGAYDAAAYVVAHQTAHDGQAVAELQPRRAGAGHFMTTQRAQFAPFAPAQLAEATSALRSRARGATVASPVAMRHVSKEHFATTSRSQFAQYDAADYAKNESRAASREYGINQVSPRHVGAGHFATTTKSSFPEYDAQQILAANRDAAAVAAAGAPRGGGSAPTGGQPFTLRHASQHHFVTTNKAQFPVYSGDVLMAQRKESAPSGHAAYVPRRAAPGHFVTSNKTDYLAPSSAAPSAAPSQPHA